MSPENSKGVELTYDQLLQQNQTLLAQVEELQKQQFYTWEIYAETSRKLQVYSASIKAAVSSLLNYDIFWDSANQHEFLETINSSVSQVSELIVLLTLAFRTEAGSLELKRDPHMLQEILSVAQASAFLKFPGIGLDISFPREGKMVLVDYEYLTKALLLIFEVIYTRNPTEYILIQASEGDSSWSLDFSGFDPQIMETIHQMHYCRTEPLSINFLSAENILRLHIACEVANLQDISIEFLDQAQSPVLRLWVPAISLA
jgi:hypothetical protein